MNDEYYMNIAIKEAKKAFKTGNVPIGAVIVKYNKIIAQAHNKKNSKHNAIMHAEIIAISKACKKLKTWYLDDCTIYITMEPCMMCAGAIKESRIKKVIFDSKNSKTGSSHLLKNIKIQELNQKSESLKLLKMFFRNKRN